MTPAARPQTIQIFLPLGDPRGIRVAEITTRIVQLIEVPRPQLDVFLAMPESVAESGQTPIPRSARRRRAKNARTVIVGCAMLHESHGCRMVLPRACARATTRQP